MFRVRLVAALIVAAGVVLPAQRSGTRVATETVCASTLGAGLDSRRNFCDVLIGGSGQDSVAVPIPPHLGTAMLQFDLHNRFSVPGPASPPVLAFARHEAIVAVLTSTGDVIGRAAVVREFRTMKDLFDRIGGGSRPDGIKAVAPGPAEPVRLAVPAGVDVVGIVGSRLTVLTRANGWQTFDTPGRPVAMISSVRVEYRPAP